MFVDVLPAPPISNFPIAKYKEMKGSSRLLCGTVKTEVLYHTTPTQAMQMIPQLHIFLSSKDPFLRRSKILP